MALLFKREAPVLHFGPRLPKDPSTKQRMRWSERRFVLWPALMYRVVAPEVRDRELNVLQKAVLGMCRAGTTNVQRIGDRLHIHPDLAALIYLELQERGLLRSNGLPTEKGRELFEEETLDARRMVTGHVFQDPWSGDLWPRFVEKLDYVELQQNPNGFPDLVLGSKGKPRRERAFMVLPGDLAIPPAPGASDIVRVTRRHRSALRRSESYESADEDDTFAHAGSIVLERVSLVDDRPTPVFVTSFMYLPKAGDLAGEWHACDPFGLGVSPTLRRALEREMRSSSGLRSVLEGMIGRSLDKQIEEQQRWAAEIRAMAINNVEKALSISARDLPQYEDLVALEYAHVEAELLGDSCPDHKLRALVRDVQAPSAAPSLATRLHGSSACRGRRLLPGCLRSVGEGRWLRRAAARGARSRKAQPREGRVLPRRQLASPRRDHRRRARSARRPRSSTSPRRRSRAEAPRTTRRRREGWRCGSRRGRASISSVGAACRRRRPPRRRSALGPRPPARLRADLTDHEQEEQAPP
jgi:hypothetical protein